LLRKRGLAPSEIPPETDYRRRLERLGIGLSHQRLRDGQPMTDQDIITYLVHSRVTEQRASEEMRLLLRIFRNHPELGRAIRMISADEDNHLAS
jgi:hypothetical protein